MKSAGQVARWVTHIDIARLPRCCLIFHFQPCLHLYRRSRDVARIWPKSCVTAPINVLTAGLRPSRIFCSSHRVWPPRRYHSAMTLHSNLPFTLLPLLAVLIPSFVIQVIAVPTCGLISHQVRESLGPPNTTPSAGNGSLEDVVATGWYPGWLGDQFPPTKISWDKYTALTFAFA